MRHIPASFIPLLLLGVVQAQTASAAGAGEAAAGGSPNAMTITRNGMQPSVRGPADFFTGTARIDPLFEATAPSRMSGGQVTFEPGARSNWHTHPGGQILLVTSGYGRTQEWGKPIQELRPGDVVWCPPGVKHWHGASPTTSLTHVALQETSEGKAVQWLEKVSDAQYGGK